MEGRDTEQTNPMLFVDDTTMQIIAFDKRSSN